jgi:hypothetical protein
MLQEYPGDTVVVTIKDKTNVEINIHDKSTNSDVTYKCTWEFRIFLDNFPQHPREYVDREADQVTFVSVSIENDDITATNEYEGTYRYPITLNDPMNLLQTVPHQ